MNVAPDSAASAVLPAFPISRRERILLGGVTLLVAVLLFTRLGSSYIWQDEGQVAFLAANTLEAGVPVAWDGRNLNNDQNFGHFFREDDLVWVMHTWMPMYLAAAGIAVGGHTAAAVRAPFVLWAVAAVPLLFIAVRRTTGRRRLAWLAVAVMATNAPFYLYARQGNYYAVFYVLGILLWWALLRLGSHPRAWVVLGGSAALLYHNNALPFFGLYAALGLTLLACRAGRAQWVAFVQATIVVMVTTLPFFLWAGTAARGGDVALRFPGQSGYGAFLYRSLSEAGLAVIPWALMPLAALRRPTADASRVAGTWTTPVRAAAWLLGGFVLVFPVYSPLAFQRYYCVVFPLGYFLVAAAVDAVWHRRRWAGVLLLLLLCLTSAGFAFTWLPLRAWAAVRSRSAPHYTRLVEGTQSGLGPVFRGTDLFRYFTELAHDFDGPTEAIVTYLNAHAQAEDLLLISYPHEPITFYTNLRVCNRLYPDDPLAGRFPSYISGVQWPDWVIHRAQYPNTVFDYERFLTEQSVHYERIELDAVDTTWENRPLPHAHRYRTAVDGPRVVIWKRRATAPLDPWHLAEASRNRDAR